MCRERRSQRKVDGRDKPDHDNGVPAARWRYSAGPANSSRLPSGSLTMKVLAPQGSFLQRLEERHARGLELEEQLLDLLVRIEPHVGRQQALAVPEAGSMTGCVHVLEVEEAAVALHLGVERRLAVDEDDGEAELLREEVAGRLDVGDEQLCGRGADDGLGCRGGCVLWHGIDPCLERLPAFEPGLSRDQLLCVAELEARCEDLRIAQMAEARQDSPDLRRHRIVPIAMPAQDELGLLLEVLEIGHGRATVDVT